ncbi:hypothetical protein ACOI9X_16585 [Pseudomonas sp. P2757]|uniref:hypothetical protein n=1 Tax=unclassified Pseudomonas TaxID=196821 RepID=UPI003B5A521D
MSLIYQDPTMTHDRALRLLASGADAETAAALISIGLNESDRIWAQNTCLKHFEAESELVVAAAVTALGHIARRHGEVDKESVIPALDTVKTTFSALAGVVEDTLDDIHAFT